VDCLAAGLCIGEDERVDAILTHLDSTRADIVAWEDLARDTRLLS
jgi:hypothetical protein